MLLNSFQGLRPFEPAILGSDVSAAGTGEFGPRGPETQEDADLAHVSRGATSGQIRDLRVAKALREDPRFLVS